MALRELISAGSMGLTRERIRQIKEASFRKLRHPSRQNALSALEHI